MKAIEKGHKYELKTEEADNFAATPQILTFLKKAPIEGSKKLQVIYPGTTTEEVLKVLINRMKYLQSVVSSRENQHVITLMEKAMMWLEKRTYDRKKRKVEGTREI